MHSYISWLQILIKSVKSRNSWIAFRWELLTAETIFADLGIPTSTAINMFLRSVVRYGGIPFDLRISPSELETIRAIDDVNHDRNMSKTYDSVAEVMDDLD